MIEPASSQDLIGTLGINGKLFVAQLVNFAIVLVAMWRWVYRPLVKMMDARAREIADGLRNADAAKQKLAEAVTERGRMLRETKTEAHTILQATHKKSEELRDEEIRQTHEEIRKIRNEAMDRIQHERDASFHALKNDVADLVARATQKVAGRMDEKAQRAQIADAIKEI
ncbi:MAG: F0F1 ATP synthase subunit B [Patescibacteria group bacterium]